MTLLDGRLTPSDELDEISSLAQPLSDPADLDRLLDRTGDARFVLLGEASHGTADYYWWRAEITRRLITEREFSFVAVEGDWPDCFAVNRWVKGAGAQDQSARSVLGGFERWPTWMWANEEVAAFTDWLRDHNHQTGGRVGFYGLDVYSLWDSLRVVSTYLHDRLPEAAGAERYYRTMARADGESWNVRDCHMADTLDRLIDHHGPGAKAVVWEHNTHVGDARGTDMAAAGMVNLGQLARERHGTDDVVLVGFGSHHGSVIAASSWGAPMQSMAVPPAPPGTQEDLLQHANLDSALLVFGDRRDTPWLSARRGHRAVGVVYDPSADRFGNWVPTTMGRRYDAFCYFESTDALHPLRVEPATGGERETYPWAT